MAFTKKEIELLFGIFNESLTKLTASQLSDLLKGDLEITFTERHKDSDKNINLKELIEEISYSKSRGSAVEYLVNNKSLKKDLVELGEYLQIHLNRSDTKEQIIDKIIDATFGVTSRSKAIKGLDLKRR